MASKFPQIRPSDLPNKTVYGADGKTLKVKVIQSESPTLPYDLLAGFRSNVRRITDERRKRMHAANTPKT